MSKIKLDSKGMRAILKSREVAAAVRPYADRVATEVDSDVQRYTTDRAHFVVGAPAHEQARDGVLTRAASRAGLEIGKRG